MYMRHMSYHLRVYPWSVVERCQLDTYMYDVVHTCLFDVLDTYMYDVLPFARVAVEG